VTAVSDAPVSLTPTGPPETVLPDEPAEVRAAVEAALERQQGDVRPALAAVVEQWPRSLLGWGNLGDHGRDVIEAYAAYRVGYHRGLDSLRQNGWRGSGFVRWEHPSNRGFLRSLAGLHRCADAIGEADEAQRCAHFLLQLDPNWPPADLG
jgi:hypothetical protein